MDNRKKSFLFYFDNYPMLVELPPDQRGWLVTALCVYAETVSRDQTVTMEQVMDTFPQLQPQARMAGSFMGATILRDTQRWLNQRRLRQERRRGQETGQGRGQPPEVSEQENERIRLDIEQTRRLLERIRMAE